MSRSRGSPVKLLYRRSAGRKEYRWYDYDSRGNLHRVWLGTTNRKLADTIVRNVERQRLSPESPSLAHLYRRFIANQRPHVKPATIYYYRRTIRRFLEWLRDRGITSRLELEAADIRAYPARLARDYAPATVNAHLRGTRRYLHYWDLRGCAKQLETVREPLRPKRILTPDEIRALLEVANDKYRMMILTLVATGLSVSEMLALTWPDIDFRRGVIHAISGIKRRRPRLIPIHPILRAALEAWPQADHLVFPSRLGGPMRGSSIAQQFKRLVKRAQIAPATPHDLRRTFISFIVNAGYPAEIAQELAGHSDVRVTREHYLHVRADTLRAAIAELPLPKAEKTSPE